MAGNAGERTTAKASRQWVGNPSSRRLLISYRNTATNGPTMAKPETSGKIRCKAPPTELREASASPASA